MTARSVRPMPQLPGYELTYKTLVSDVVYSLNKKSRQAFKAGNKSRDSREAGDSVL